MAVPHASQGDNFQLLTEHSDLKDLTLSKCSSVPPEVCQQTQLESLTIHGSNLGALPEGIGQLSNLQCFDLVDCHELESLPNSISQLTALTHLSVSGCSSLMALPQQLGELRKLLEVNISQCDQLCALPASLGELTALTRLAVDSCSLKSLPNSIVNLRQLQQLKVHCSSLRRLPEQLGQLQHLQLLDLSGCSLDMLPDSITNLQQLQQLMVNCSSLRRLPEQLGQLQHLQLLALSGCSNIDSLPDSITTLKQLQQLNVNCSSLRWLPEQLGLLRHLHWLDLPGCSNIELLPTSMTNLVQLQQLKVSCSGLRELPEQLGQLQHLNWLDLSGCSSLQSLPNTVGELKALTYLELGHCAGLITLPDSIGQLQDLKVLDCRNCTGLVTLPESSLQLLSLECLDLTGCVGLPCLSSVSSLRRTFDPMSLLHLIVREQQKQRRMWQARSVVEPHQTASTNRRVTVVYGAMLLVCGLLSLATYTGLCQGLTVSAGSSSTAAAAAARQQQQQQHGSSLEYAFRFCNGVSFVASLCCIMVSLVAVMALNYMPLMAGDPCDKQGQSEFIRMHGAEGALLSAKGNSWLNQMYSWSLACFVLSMFAVSAACILAALHLMGFQGLGPAAAAVSGVLFVVVCVLLGLRRRFQDMFDAPTKAQRRPGEEMELLTERACEQTAMQWSNPEVIPV
jgi:Leucine-rich repeat (LRR) protein